MKALEMYSTRSLIFLAAAWFVPILMSARLETGAQENDPVPRGNAKKSTEMLRQQCYQCHTPDFDTEEISLLDLSGKHWEMSGLLHTQRESAI